MAPKKATTKNAAVKKSTAKKAAPKKSLIQKAAQIKGASKREGSSDADSDVLQELPSPTNSVGPTWDAPLRRLYENVQNAVDNGPLPALNKTPIHFHNPGNYCYRNAMMTMLMYTPQLLGYVQRWHMPQEFGAHPYNATDHILQAIDRVSRAYHSTVSTRVADTNAAMHNLWQVFRGASSSVSPWPGALPEPQDAEQEDSSFFLVLMLSEVEAQLRDGWLPNTGDQTQEVFSAMLKTSFTIRNRCPGTQDGLCPNPNQKQRRDLEEELLFNVFIPAGEDLTLSDCIADGMRVPDETWCDACRAQMRHVNDDTKNRHDQRWRNLRDCPEVLLMKIGRFTQVGIGSSFRAKKIIKDIKIPEVLDVSEFLEYHNYGEGSRVEYELAAVVSHIGTGQSGHYVAHVKAGEKWWRIDDLGDRNGVTPSSIKRINMDGGGRSFNSTKGQSHPFLLSWVKVREDIVAPSVGAVKMSTSPNSKGGKASGKSSAGGKDVGTEDEVEKGTGSPSGKGPKTPEPPAPPADGDDTPTPPPAAKGTADLWITLNIGDGDAMVTVKRNLKIILDCSKSVPVSGDIRILDDKGKLFALNFGNKKGKELLAVKDADKSLRANETKNASSPPAAKKRGIKRKAPEPEETYIDPDDHTFIDPFDKKATKNPKAGAKKAAPNSGAKSASKTPEPVRKRGRLTRGRKPNRSESDDEVEEPAKGRRKGAGKR